MSIVSRQEWGARSPTFVTQSLAFHGVAVHWEGPHMGWPWAHSECFEKVRGIQAFHMDTRQWADVAYNLIVCGHGDVFVGRGRDVQNAANGGQGNDNSEFYAICYLGGEEDEFTLEARDGINDGAEFLGVAQGGWHTHRDFISTACPGDVIAGWVANGHPRAQQTDTEDFLMGLNPDQQIDLLATTKATNEEVGKLAVAIRDQTSGLVTASKATNDEVGKLAVAIRDETSGLAAQVAVLRSQVAEIRADVEAIKVKVGA